MRYTLLLLVLCAGLLPAQTTEKRLALVIGNSGYATSPLTNPANDARSMAAVLRRAGFEVTEKYDLNIVGFNNAVTDFTRQFSGDNVVALFYYAGHGIQDHGENYLVPIDADSLADDQITYRCVPLKRITSKMRSANNYTNILILDACRQYPLLGEGRSLQRGLAQLEDGLPESLVAYATAPGRIALDRREQANGLFTGQLLKYIEMPGQEINELFFEVRKAVKEQSGDQQIPSVTNNLTHKFYFFPRSEPTPSVVPKALDSDKDGVPDADDRCPNNPGPVQLRGCPDSDNDGVIDMLDKCPHEPGPPDHQGCPKEKTSIKESAGWEHGFGVSYSRFGKRDENGTYLRAVSFNAYQVYYTLVNKIGGYVSLGAYSGVYDLSGSSGYKISTRMVGAVGPGARLFQTSSGVKGHFFAGIMFFAHGKNTAQEIFGHTTNFIGYEFLLAVRMRQAGIKAGYVTGFEQVKGATVGVQYWF